MASLPQCAIPVVGLPLQITRTYDSRDKRTNDFGVGWSLDIRNVRLQKTRNLGANWNSSFTTPWYSLDSIKPRRITITLAGDKTYQFESVLNPSQQFGSPIESTRMTFTNLPATYGRLEIDGDNQAHLDGFVGFVNLINIEDFSYFNPTRFKFTTADGDVFIIDEREGLKSLTDRNHNTLTITTNGIFHSTGVSVAFTRDALGRITTITDPAGNPLHYAYGTSGSLSAFTDRVTNSTSFAYTNTAFPNYLTEITDPRGVKAIRTEFDASGRMVRQIDGNGNAIEFTHDLSNNREIVRDRLGHVTIHEYDERGNVLRSTDALGHVTTQRYDAVDNELEKVDALANTNRFTYDAQGNKLTETDPLGYTTRYTYGAFRELTSITNPRGFTTTNRYDETGNKTETRDPLGNVTRFEYDGKGNLLTITDPLGNTVESQYDVFGRLTNSITRDVRLGVLDPSFTYDANGNRTAITVNRTTSEAGSPTVGVETTVFLYDTEGRPIGAVYPDGSSIQTLYNAISKPAVLVDPLGRTNVLQYDERGNLVRTDYADGAFQLLSYDAENWLVAVQDRAGRTMRFTNDALGRPISVVYPDGAATHTEYDAVGRVIATTDERGHATRYAYDPNCGCSGRKTMETNALGEVTRHDFDQKGNLTSTTDPMGRTTTYVYDANDRLERIVFADGSTQGYLYDALDRQIAEIDQATNVSWFAYDARDRLVAVTNAMGGVTTFAYDEVGNLVSFTDAEGRMTRYAYNSLGQRISRTLPGGQVERYRYDAAGNLTNRIDFNGRSTLYQYDLRNRLTLRVPDPAFGEPIVNFTYTLTDRRASMTDASGATLYFYNERDWLTNKITPQGTLAYLYDPAGNVTGIRSLNSNGVELTYDYDALNRLTAVNDSRLGRTTHHYNPAGSLSHYRYANGLTSTNEFNALHWVTNLTTLTAQETALNSYRYTLAPSGKRLSVTEPGRRTVTYGYDALQRLTSEINTGPEGSLAVNYTFDRLGNRLTRNSQTYGYDANDRLAGETYDANGNPLTGAVINATNGQPVTVSDQFDSEDRIKNRNGGQVQVLYDGDGDRVAKTINGVTTYYLVDELNPSGYGQVLEELTSSNGQPALVSRVYAYDYALISQDQLVDDGQGGLAWVASFYGYDDEGNVRYLTDTAGNVTDTYDYDAFGNLIQQSGGTSNNYLYRGEQFDPDLGLYYLRARYLNPDTGRFWTRDPFEGLADEPFSLHPYLYANADPVNNYDPSGYFTLAEVQQSSGIAARLRLTNLSPRFAKAAKKFCTILRKASQAADAYQTAMQVRSLAAGAAAGLGADIYGEFLIEAYDLKGLEQYDLFTQQANLGAGEDIYIRSRNQTPCFTAGTLISTEHGLRPIETLNVGDKVWALGQGTVELALKPVTQTFSNTVSRMVVLTVGEERIETTPEHPFWVKDEGWICGGLLKAGDQLLTRDGTWLPITSVEPRQASITVFNFEVAGFHTYIVGERGVVVHNSVGRSGKTARLLELLIDSKTGRAIKGWIQQEVNRGRGWIRNPPGKDMAHWRGYEAAKGCSYKHSSLQDRSLHRTQHKYDNYGRKNNFRGSSQ